MSAKNLSTKTKTMVLVLFLFLLLSSIFSYLRYFELIENQQTLRANSFLWLSNFYDDKTKEIFNFYENRALANLNSNGVKDALSKQDIANLEALTLSRYKVLSKENSFLKAMIFIDKNDEKILNFGESIKISNLTKTNNSFEFFIYKNKLYFAVSTLAYNENLYIGALVFVVDSKFLLTSEIGNLQTKVLLNNQILKLENQENFKIQTIDIKQKNQSIAKLYAMFDLSEQNAKISNLIFSNTIIVLVLFVLIFLILNYGFDVLIKKLEESNEKLLLSQSMLQNTNQNLELRVKAEIEKRMQKELQIREKERLLIHQSKLASMGEMIGNIAHQWRQPLTELGAIFVKIGILNDQTYKQQMLSDELAKCDKLIKFMSKTIDDFRNFFSFDKSREKYCINSYVKDTIKLINGALKSHKIECEIFESEQIYTTGYPREFSQVVLNLLSNAKDVLIERNIQNPKIIIRISNKNSQNFIHIEDNGGGIKAEPIEKIFEPYYTTKHASSGTGIGLYMSKNIIEKNNLGELKARNSQNGAVFEIILS